MAANAQDNFLLLEQLPIGSRLLVRSRVDWRIAAVSRHSDDRIVLTVCSPSGRTYRLRRAHGDRVAVEGSIPVLCSDYQDHWLSNFSSYDGRW